MKKLFKKISRLRDKLDTYLMAATFAESGCPEYAREIIEENAQKDKFEEISEKLEKILDKYQGDSKTSNLRKGSFWQDDMALGKIEWFLDYEDNIGSTLSITFVYYYNQGLYQISGRRNLDGIKEVPVRTTDLDTAYGLLETRLSDISKS